MNYNVYLAFKPGESSARSASEMPGRTEIYRLYTWKFEQTGS